MRLLITRNYEHMSAEAARIVTEAVRTTPNLTIALPTGNTPKGMYRELVRVHIEENLDFSAVTFFNLDEYLGLPEGHPDTFQSYLWREFFRHINANADHIYGPDADYEHTIRKAGGIDLLISGIGTNGHIAFNEPGSPLDSRTRVVELADTTLNEMARTFTPDELPRRAITLGLATILESRRLVLLAAGPKKSKILARALRGPVDIEVPASIVQLHPDAVVVADEHAGKNLKAE
jgi:glucosamine-6-phosphate deaminase